MKNFVDFSQNRDKIYVGAAIGRNVIKLRNFVILSVVCRAADSNHTATHAKRVEESTHLRYAYPQ